MKIRSLPGGLVEYIMIIYITNISIVERDTPLIYLDHSATTPLDPRVLEAMMPHLTSDFGNTTSVHRFGRRSEQAVEQARSDIAAILNCKPREVVFTSGGSESDNLAVRGIGWHRKLYESRNHLVTSPVEHSAVSNTMLQMQATMGFRVSIAPVNDTGQVTAEVFESAITDDTAIASIVYANNEVGTVNPIAELAAVAHNHNVIFHTDAVQAAGQLQLDVDVLNVDLLSLSAHKFYGPQGVGLLYCREGLSLHPAQTGGNHERGNRAGTLNVAGIVGMAEALKLAYEEHAQRVHHLTTLRDQLIQTVLSQIPGSQVTGHHKMRLPSHASFVFSDVDANTLLMHLDMEGVAASSGSACKSGNPRPSDVLLAMGKDPVLAMSGLRLTVGMATTAEDVESAVGTLSRCVERVRKLRQMEAGT